MSAPACGLPLDGPEPPEWMRGSGSLGATNRAIWLRDNNPHLLVHEELRLAKAGVSRARSSKAPGYALRFAEERLQEAELAFADYHAEAR